MRRTIDRLRLIQIDSVNVLVRAHYMPFFSRLGPYRREMLDELAYRDRYVFEQWAHEACFIPLADYSLLRHRMDRGRRWHSRHLTAEDRRAWLWESWRFVKQIFPLLVIGVFAVGMIRARKSRATAPALITAFAGAVYFFLYWMIAQQ